LYEKDGEFVLSVELLWFDPSISRRTGGCSASRPNMTASGAARPGRTTAASDSAFASRRIVDDERVTAEYTNGVLEVRPATVSAVSQCRIDRTPSCGPTGTQLQRSVQSSGGQ